MKLNWVHNFLVISVMILMASVSCTTDSSISAGVTPTVADQTITSPTAIEQIVTRTGTPTPNLFEESPTANILPTSTIISDSVPAITPTPTLLPTISPEAAEAFALELMKNNNGCRLPCWWGATPGITSWSETERFLQTFVSEIIRLGLGRPIVSYSARLYIPNKENIEKVIGSSYDVSEDTIINIGGSESPPNNYSLPNLLTEYGIPDDIWMVAYSNTPVGTHPARFVLIYSQLGFAATYEIQDAIEQDESLMICPEQASRVLLYLATPENNIDFQMIKEMGSIVGREEPYQPLVEATGISIAVFYATFQDIDGDECIETPMSIWP